MFRENAHSQVFKETEIRFSELEDNRIAIRRPDIYRLPILSERTLVCRILYRLNGKYDVIGRHFGSVMKEHSLSELDRIHLSILGNLRRFSHLRLQSPFIIMSIQTRKDELDQIRIRIARLGKNRIDVPWLTGNAFPVPTSVLRNFAGIRHIECAHPIQEYPDGDERQSDDERLFPKTKRMENIPDALTKHPLNVRKK